MKKLVLVLVVLVLVLLVTGCVDSSYKAPSPDEAITKNGDVIDLGGAKMVMLSCNTNDASRNEEDVIAQINNYLTRDIDIISFSRFYDPDTSRLLRCEIIYRELIVP